ncbi:MAG: tetratricopeptide repeat protein [Saprospiraceae bacterium]
MKLINRFFITLCLVLGITIIHQVNAQSVEEEIGFVYVKAEYLFSTGRYDDAVPLYNQVISKDPKYKSALVHRGECKFALAAYKGSKADALQSIDLQGITAESAALLGRSFAQMREHNAAISSLTAAIALDGLNADYLIFRAEEYEKDGSLLKACHDYESAMKMGNAAAAVKARNLCGISSPTSTHPTQPKQQDTSSDTKTNNTSDGEDQLEDGEVLTASNDSTESTKTSEQVGSFGDTIQVNTNIPVIDPNLPQEDDFINKIKIDDDVNIDIYGQELGRRKVEEVPSILILADENGKVVVNICVNKNGDVVKAEFEPNGSTIAKKSLVSLAIRKAKEFIFEPGKYESQCGFMVFYITGS